MESKMESVTKQQKSRVFTTKEIVAMGFLSTLSYILMLLESPPYLGFLRIEFSDIPAIIGAIQFGPVAGIVIEFIKNFIKAVTATKTGYVGELANFIVSVAFVVPSAYLFRKLKGKFKAFPAFSAGIIIMAITGCLVNYFITIPLYATMFGGLDNIIGAAAATIPAIKDLPSLIIIGITPFNIVKGIMMSVVGFYTYKLLKNRI